MDQVYNTPVYTDVRAIYWSLVGWWAATSVRRAGLGRWNGNVVIWHQPSGGRIQLRRRRAA